MKEDNTRKKLIDQQLQQAGWDITDKSQVVEEYIIKRKEDKVEEPRGHYKTNQFADYVLLGKNGKPLAVIEAKSSIKDAALGREQAKQYCYALQQQTQYILPFCFYTNGYELYFWDIEHAPPRKVVGYPTLADLERYLHLRENRKSLDKIWIDTNIAGRSYQLKAIRTLLERLEEGRQKFLWVMATGTGKTRTCIALIDALMRARWIKRVLFLVDRITLREQALDAFKEHLPHEPRWPNYQEKKLAKNRKIYVSTYPTMLNIIREEGNLSPHFFDLIIVDESHRSIYNTYQEVLSHFNTITIGLTATPTEVIDHNTFQLFNCENGLPTFAYTYEEAVNNNPPYLCDFQVLKIKTKFQEKGINKRTVSLEDQKKLLLEGQEIADINFEGTELERKVINKGTNALIVQQFMEESIKDSYGVVPGKTIFFCANIKHARRIELLFNELYPQYKGELARVLVSEDPRVYGKGGLLEQFKTKNYPRVAISVDMLDTGLDVREIVNLVFAKPVYSYTKFWQMIGRGTRLLEPNQLKPWCPQKDVFLIMDCWDNFDYFQLKPKGRTIKTPVPIPVKLFGLRLEKLNFAWETNQEKMMEHETQQLLQLLQLLPTNSIVVKEQKPQLQKVSRPIFWQQLSAKKMEYLHQTIKPLLRTLSGVDYKAMVLEKDILEASLAFHKKEDLLLPALLNKVVEKIARLPLSIEAVAQKKKLILATQIKAFWENIEEAGFNQLIEQLAPLAKYLGQQTTLGKARFNFKDELVTKERVEFGPQNEAVSISQYKKMVEEKINALKKHHPFLQKLLAGQSLQTEEIEQLAKELYSVNPHITLDLLRQVYHHKKASFIRFIKHILGLEQLASFEETVVQAFDEFLQQHQLSSRQLEFLDLLKKFILEKENLEKRNLIESPFTLIHPEGIRGVFSPQEIQDILQLTNKLLAA